MFVFLNYALSADGKISTRDGRGSAFSSRIDKQRMDIIRAGADVIVVGAETARLDNPPFHLRDDSLVADRLAGGRPPHPAVCLLSRSGRLPPDLRVFHQDLQPVVVASPQPFPPIAGARASAGWVPLPRRRPLAGLMASFAWRGWRRVLVEGGGEVNALFLQAGLVDEVHCTLCPVLLGGRTAPTPFDGLGFPADAAPRLDLLSVDRAGGELFLRYRVRRSPDRPPAGG